MAGSRDYLQFANSKFIITISEHLLFRLQEFALPARSRSSNGAFSSSNPTTIYRSTIVIRTKLWLVSPLWRHAFDWAWDAWPIRIRTSLHGMHFRHWKHFVMTLRRSAWEQFSLEFSLGKMPDARTFSCKTLTSAVAHCIDECTVPSDYRCHHRCDAVRPLEIFAKYLVAFFVLPIGRRVRPHVMPTVDSSVWKRKRLLAPTVVPHSPLVFRGNPMDRPELNVSLCRTKWMGTN